MQKQVPISQNLSLPLTILISFWTERAWRTASTTFPVPASPFVRSIAAPSAIRRCVEAANREGRPKHKGTRQSKGWRREWSSAQMFKEEERRRDASFNQDAQLDGSRAREEREGRSLLEIKMQRHPWGGGGEKSIRMLCGPGSGF